MRCWSAGSAGAAGLGNGSKCPLEVRLGVLTACPASALGVCPACSSAETGWLGAEAGSWSASAAGSLPAGCSVLDGASSGSVTRAEMLVADGDSGGGAAAASSAGRADAGVEVDGCSGGRDRSSSSLFSMDWSHQPCVSVSSIESGARLLALPVGTGAQYCLLRRAAYLGLMSELDKLSSSSMFTYLFECRPDQLGCLRGHVISHKKFLKTVGTCSCNTSSVNSKATVCALVC